MFLLIGRTSALTMNFGGVVKDWLLIGLSIAMYRSPVSRLNLAGYSVAFLSVSRQKRLCEGFAHRALVATADDAIHPCLLVIDREASCLSGGMYIGFPHVHRLLSA